MAANPVDSIDIFNRQPVDLETLLSNASTPAYSPIKSLEDQKRDDNRSFLDKTVEGYEEGVPLPAQIALGFTVPGMAMDAAAAVKYGGDAFDDFSQGNLMAGALKTGVAGLSALGAIPLVGDAAGVAKRFLLNSPYITTKGADEILPLSQIKASTDQFGRALEPDTSKVNLARNMMTTAKEGSAYKNVNMDLRQPLEVLRLSDGTFQQIGGKSTKKALEELGETNAPVKIFNTFEEFDVYDIARKEAKEAKRIANAKKLQPEPGNPTFEGPVADLGDAKLVDLNESIFTNYQAALQTPDAMFDVATRVNDGFQSSIAKVADDLGLEKANKFKVDPETGKLIDVEIKELDTLYEKIGRKSKDSPEFMTDAIRTRVFVNNADEANEMARRVSQEFSVIDSGNQVYKSSGYADRKLIIQYEGPGGEKIIGELQLVHPAMSEAADIAHPIYKQVRNLDTVYPDGSLIPKNVIKQTELKLNKEMRVIFDAAQAKMDPSLIDSARVLNKRYGGQIGRSGSDSPIDPNMFSNSDFDKLEPFSYQSAILPMPAGLQSLSSGFIKNAKYPDSSELGDMTAGPLSQEKYSVSIDPIVYKSAKNNNDIFIELDQEDL